MGRHSIPVIDRMAAACSVIFTAAVTAPTDP